MILITVYSEYCERHSVSGFVDAKIEIFCDFIVKVLVGL